MPGAGLTGTIQRLIDDIKKLWSWNRPPSAPALVLARKCSLIGVNVQVLGNFLESDTSTSLSISQRDEALQLIEEATRTVRSAVVLGKKSRANTEKRVDQIAQRLRQLGVGYSLEMEWGLPQASDSSSPIVAAVTELSTATSATNQGSPGDPSTQSILVQIHVWYRGNHHRIISDLAQPDHTYTKRYAIDESINFILKDLCDEGFFPIDSKIGCYVRSQAWHRYTRPGLRWLRQKPHTRTIESLPPSTTDVGADVVLDIVVDTKPFVLLVQHMEQSKDASGIVVHPCDQDSLDSIVAKGLKLENSLFYYQNLDGSGPQACLAQQLPEPFKCDWCVLPGCCPTRG